MDIAALILSTLSMLVAGACLVLLLAKRYSTHRVEYVNVPSSPTMVEELPLETLAPQADEPPIPAVPRKTWTLEEYQRTQALNELEQHLGEYEDF